MKAKRGRRLPFLVIATAVVVGALSGLVCASLAWDRERAMRTRCASTLGILAYDVQVYAFEHNGAFPPTLGHLYPEYTVGLLFLCPGARKAISVEHDTGIWREAESDLQNVEYTPAMFGDTHTDYVYVSGLIPADPEHYIIAFDDEWNHDGEGVFATFVGDINVEWVRDIKGLHEQLARQEKEVAARGREMKLVRPAWSAWPDPSVSADPRAGPRPWYRRPNGSAVLVGTVAGALAALLVLVVATLKRRGGTGEASPGDARSKGPTGNGTHSEA